MMNVVRLRLALTVFLLTTSPALADNVLGTWSRDNGAVHVKFDTCGDAICGNIAWLKPGGETKAKVGQRLFFDMHPDGTNSWTAKPSMLTVGQSIQEKCLLKDLPSAPRAASSVD
jgi:uncharacterized protein (DUF2147 family)